MSCAALASYASAPVDAPLNESANAPPSGVGSPPVVYTVCSSKRYGIAASSPRLPRSRVNVTVQRWPEPRLSFATATSSTVASASSPAFTSAADASNARSAVYAPSNASENVPARPE